jgi:hypothetical protein
MIDKNIEKNRLFGTKIIKFSPLGTLLFGVIVFIGYHFYYFPIQLMVLSFILGLVLSPFVVKQYRTGNPLYAKIYGGLLGIGFFIIFFFITSSSEMNIKISVVAGLYGVSCIFLGISVVFTILRRKLIHYIQFGDW